ncbi:MAG: MarR family winged helix-turn-helix transcriptional regulator [Rhodospirillales bacterium]
MRGDVPESDDVQRSIGFLIGEVSRLLRIVYDRRVEPLGLTRSQWRLLVHLRRREGPTQSELAAALEIERPTAGQLIDRLEAKGWVERRADDRDLRTRRVFIAEAVQPLLHDMMELAESVHADALDGLPAGDAERLVDILLHIKGNLSRIAADGGGNGRG